MSLIVSQIDHQFNFKRIIKPRKIDYEIKTISEIADDLGASNAAGCLVNSTLVARGEKPRFSRRTKTWGDIPPDHSTLIFINTPLGLGGVVNLGQILHGVKRSIGLFKKVKSIFVPKVPSLSSLAGQQNSSFTFTPNGRGYGFNGIEQAVTTGTPRQMVYGKIRTGGMLVQRWKTSNPATYNEVYNCITFLSEGPIQSVGGITADSDDLETTAIPEGIRINNREAASFPSAKFSVRMGDDDQTAVPQASEVVIGYDYNEELRTAFDNVGAQADPGRPPFPVYATNYTDRNSYFEHAFRDIPDAVEINIFFPDGLYRFSGSHEGPTWAQIKFVIDIRAAKTSPGVPGTLVFDGQPAILITSIPSSTQQGSSSSQEQYRTYRIDNLKAAAQAVLGDANAAMEIHCYRYNPNIPRYEFDGVEYHDKLILSGVNEILYAELRRPFSALCSYTIEGTDEISGQIPKTTFDVEGRLVDTYPNGEADRGSPTNTYTTNPSWIIVDILISDPGLGSKISIDDVDLDAFADWADYCDTLVLPFTGSTDPLEKRYEFNFMLDSRERGIGAVQRLASQARGTIIFNGRSVRVVVDEQKTASQLIAPADIVRDSLKISWLDQTSKHNFIEATYLDEDNQWEQSRYSAAWQPDEVPNSDEEKLSLSLSAMTRSTQVARHSHFVLRDEKLHQRSIEFEMGISGLAVQVGDVFFFPDEAIGWSQSFKIDAHDGSTITMSAPFTFEADVIYTYYERGDDNVTRQKDFQISAGSTDTLPFAPLQAGDARQRLGVVGKEQISVSEWIATDVSPADGFKRRVRGIDYIDEIFSDASGPLGGTPFVPSSTAPANVTNLTLVEAYKEIGVSTITASWTASAGSPTAVAYIVWTKYTGLFGETEYVVAGSTTATTIDLDITHAQGTRYTVAIQPISGSSGRESDIDALTSEFVIIARDNLNENLADFPDQVENVVLGAPSGNEVHVTWDAVAGADSYEARLGQWNEGPVLFTAVGTAADIKVDREPKTMSIRAKKGDVYSGSNTQETLPTAGYDAFTTFRDSLDEDFDPARCLSCYVAPVARRGELIIQSLRSQSMTYRTAVLDAVAEANTHISIDFEITNWIDMTIGQAGVLSDNISTDGEINARYMVPGNAPLDWYGWQLFIERSTDGVNFTDLKPIEVTPSELIGAQITASGRYFRLRVDAAGTNDSGDKIGNNGFPTRAAIQKLDFTAYQ